jgi:hypothetical protein
MSERTSELLRRPIAWMPLALSLIALVLVLGYAAIAGNVQAASPHDEGAPARVFQLLMLAAGLAIALFAVRWLPRAPRQSAAVIALQVLVAAVPVAAVVLLES